MLQENPIDSKLIVDQLYSDIKSRILKGELYPDSKLSVRVLCEYYKVSDTPLKQALNRLVSDRLVVAYPRRGMRVKAFSVKEINDAIQVRAMIELYAADAALKRAESDPDFIRSLEQNIKEDEKLVENIADVNQYSEATQKELEVSKQFHVLFIGALENDSISDIYNNVQNHSYLYYQLGIDKKEQAVNSIKEHQAIVDALRSGNKKRLEQAIKAHLSARKAIVANQKN